MLITASAIPHAAVVHHQPWGGPQFGFGWHIKVLRELDFLIATAQVALCFGIVNHVLHALRHFVV